MPAQTHIYTFTGIRQIQFVVLKGGLDDIQAFLTQRMSEASELSQNSAVTYSSNSLVDCPLNSPIMSENKWHVHI